MRRAILIILILLISAAGMLWLLTRGTGGGIGGVITRATGDVEQWVGGQLGKIANHYLGPEFSFERFAYEAPGTVTLGDVRLVEGGETILEAGLLRVTLGETPKVGRPIVISELEARDLVVRLIRQGEGGLVGFSDFVETTEEMVDEEGEAMKPSEVFAIRRLSITNGTVAYVQPGRPTMVLDQMTVDLTSEARGEAGGYDVRAALERGSLLTAELVTRLNIDTGLLSNLSGSLAMDLSAERYRVLPPRVQEFVAAHEMTGRLVMSVNGAMPLAGGGGTDLRWDASLVDGFMVLGEYQLPVDSCEVVSTLRDEVWVFERIEITALGGRTQVHGELEMSSDRPLSWWVEMQDVRLEEALRYREEDERPKYAGRTMVRGEGAMRLGAFPESLEGEGELEITEGNLLHFPVIGDLERAVGSSSGGWEGGTDRASAAMTVHGDHVAFRDIVLVGTINAARGEGEIVYDSSIDFRFNAGPLERAQELFGKVGELFGRVTDQLVKYEVTGTLQEPEVAVKPFGVGGD